MVDGEMMTKAKYGNDIKFTCSSASKYRACNRYSKTSAFENFRLQFLFLLTALSFSSLFFLL